MRIKAKTLLLVGLSASVAAQIVAAQQPGTADTLTVTTDRTFLAIGETASLRVIRTRADGSSIDVSAGASGTVYTSQNVNVATANQDGVVMAVSTGIVMVLITNVDPQDPSSVVTMATLTLHVGPPGDLDKDGLPDAWETKHGLNPLNPADAGIDSDGDGLTNLQEFNLGTDPKNPDTDGDGRTDGNEVAEHRNPLALDNVLDETWTVKVNGQVIPVGRDGTFVIPNVSAADAFGVGGPGTPPDFMSDDFIRVVGTSNAGGVTRWAYSDPFQFRSGEIYVVPSLTFSDHPPLVVQSLTLAARDPDASFIIEPDQRLELLANGRLADGSTRDVTSRKAWTIYRVSNPAVVSIVEDSDGKVFAVSHAPAPGIAYVTATNAAATAVKEISVFSHVLTTTVEGFVEFEDGRPVSGAEVTIPSVSDSIHSSAVDGFFSIPVSVSASFTSLTIAARLPNNLQEATTKVSVAIVPNGITDAGRIVLHLSCRPQWRAVGGAFPGTNYFITALTPFEDATGPALYAGGAFTLAGGVSANCIAKWNGVTWSPLGSGLNSIVLALDAFDDGTGVALYAGGNFTSAGSVGVSYVAKWDGTTWLPLGGGSTGLNNEVVAIAAFDDGSGAALYAGGAFTAAGSVDVDHIAKWNGTSWTPLGSGLNGIVRTLAVFNDGTGPALYAGGDFTSAGSVLVSHIAKWNGTAWSQLGSGLNSTVYALDATFDDGSGPTLYVGGSFSSAGSIHVSSIAKWNGTRWLPLGSGVIGYVRALATYNDGSAPALFVAGESSFAPAKWNGKTWSALGSGLSNGKVAFGYALVGFDDGTGPALYVGGDFTSAGGAAASNIAKWNGAAWTPVGNGLNGGCLALGAFDDGTGPTLYAGGAFHFENMAALDLIAKLTGNTWSTLPRNLVTLAYDSQNLVHALKGFDDGSGPTLFAGGGFFLPVGTDVSRIAKWNGATWSPLGRGLDQNDVLALTTYNDGSGTALYAGGNFVTSGGRTLNRVAKWDGTIWSPLSSGLNDIVYALAAFDNGAGEALYAGGYFSSAGTVGVINIAKWNGTIWSPLGSGLNNSVFALAGFDDGTGAALYAGGAFASAGNVDVRHIAKWNGNAWLPLGDGLNGRVNALAVFDDGTGAALYAGGGFTSANSVDVNHIAKWNGTTWAPLDSGVNSTVSALFVHDNGAGEALYVGGDFSTAGGLESATVAKWTRPRPPCPP